MAHIRLISTVIVSTFLLMLFSGTCKAQLFIKNYEVVEKKETNKIEVFNDTYFEIDLNSVNKGTQWMAEKRLIESKVGQPYHTKGYFIVDAKGQIIKWNTQQDFLNFMSKHKYDVESSDKTKYKTAFRFKKKG